MAITNYGELSTAVMRWLNRIDSDLDVGPFVGDFVDFAGAEIGTDLDANQLVTKTPITEITSNDAIPLPVDYSEMIGVYLYDGPAKENLRRQLKYMTTKDAANRTEFMTKSDEPDRYLISGHTITPWPEAQGYYYEIEYRSSVVLDTSDNNSTNVVLQNWPSLYLYGALIHSAPFLEEDGRISTWKGLYDQLVQKINDEALMSEAGTAQISMPELY